MRRCLCLVVVFTVALIAAIGFAEDAGTHTSTPPAREENNLIVAAYNIQFVGQRQHDLAKLAHVIQHFDVCGVLEIKNEAVLEELVGALKTFSDWEIL